MAAKKTTEVAEEITFSAKDLAIEAGTDPKTFRRFLRSNYAHNKGDRWVFDADAKAEILDAYAKRSVPTED